MTKQSIYNMRPLITHVAIRFDRAIYSLPKPNHHSDVIRYIRENTGANYVGCRPGNEQGFLDGLGKFLDRKQALVRALFNGQVKDPLNIRHGILFSEDIW